MVPTVTVTGRVLDSGGAPAIQGIVTARLDRPGRAPDGDGGSAWIAGEASAAIAPDGSIALPLVPNDLIEPAGSVYLVTLAIEVSPALPVRRWLERWQIAASDPNPLAVGDVTRVTP